MADLIAFPQIRNIGKARHVANLWLRRRPGRDRDSYWSSVTERYVSVMRRLGFPQTEIAKQLRGFKAAVEEQIALAADREDHRVIIDASAFLEAHQLADQTSRDDGVTDHHPGAA